MNDELNVVMSSRLDPVPQLRGPPMEAYHHGREGAEIVEIQKGMSAM